MATSLAELLRRVRADLDSAAAATRDLGSPGAGADGSRPGDGPLSIGGATVELPVHLAARPAPAAALTVTASLPGASALSPGAARLGRLRITLVRTEDEGR